MFNRLPSRKSIPVPRKSFLEKNNYPRWLVKPMMKSFFDEQTNRNAATATTVLPNVGNHRSIKRH